MPKTTLQKITDKARSIRRPGEKWIHAVKRAAKLIPSLSPSKRVGAKKTAKKKAGKKKAAVKKHYRQTGTSNKLFDERQRAKKPGKRKSSSGKKYYENRKNRSDMPGKLTGTAYRQNVLDRINSNVRLQGEAEKRLFALQQLLKISPKEDKRKVRLYIADQQKYLRQIKKDVSGFKSLLR
jgi:hypothetical protein